MKTNRCFTLIELVVAVSILALLMGILLPVLHEARKKSHLVACQVNLRSLGQANIAYADMHDQECVPVIDGSAEQYRYYWITNRSYRECIGLEKSEGAAMYVLLEEYWCPSDRRVRDDGYWATAQWVNRLSYAYNMTDRGSDSKDPYPWGKPIDSSHYVGYAVENIVNDADKIMFTDAGDFWTEMKGADYLNHWDIYGDDIKKYQNWELGLCSSPTMFRHSEGANICFFDGHVDYRKKEKMFFYKEDGQPDIRRNKGLWFLSPVNSKE
jgi:prepilin-type processing-associated H-X9-DG protein